MAGIEEMIGKRWTTWLGVLALFVSVSFFVKYALDNQWLGPSGRVILGLLFGIALLIAGERNIRRQGRILGEGLLGGGLAIVYVSLYTAFALYHLIPSSLAFAAIVLFTAGGMILAVLHDAMSLCFLAILGGLLTPIMVSTGVNARDALFTYLLLLNLGVLGIAFFKRWRAVDFLTFAGTWVLFAGWFSTYYTRAALTPTVIWVSVFYLLFLFLPFVYHLRYQVPIALERFLLALINAAIAFTFAYQILAHDHKPVLGFIALGMSATSLIMGALTRRRLTTDTTALFGFIALAVGFLTIAIPLHLHAYGISLVWAVEGPVLLYLGYRFRYFPVRIGGFLILVVTVFRFFIVHWPLHAGAFVPIVNLHFAGAAFMTLAIAAYAVVHHLWREKSAHEDWVLKITSGIGAGFLGLFLLQSELGLWLANVGRAEMSQYLVALIWALGGLTFLLVGERVRNIAVRLVGILPLLIAGFLCVAAYGLTPDYVLFMNPRFGVALLTVLVIFVAWWDSYRREADIAFQQFFFTFFELLLFLSLSLEVYTWGSRMFTDATRAGWMAQMDLSILWGIYAIVLLVSGFWRRSRGMRLTALGLFGVTALKLLVVDLAVLDQIYRILSFLITGLLMIGASYLYNRVERMLETAKGDEA
jgi:uncharacterized membrane protein